MWVCAKRMVYATVQTYGSKVAVHAPSSRYITGFVKIEAGGDENRIINFKWPKLANFFFFREDKCSQVNPSNERQV